MKTRLSILGLIVVSLNSCKKPEAGFSADKTEIYVGEIVHFYDNSENRKNCKYFYDFGDGTDSENNQYYVSTYGSSPQKDPDVTNGNPSHYFVIPGVYEVTQTVYNFKNKEKGKSVSGTAKMKITVKPIESFFVMSDTIVNTFAQVKLTNLTTFPSQAYVTFSSQQWSFQNTTNVSLSPNVSIVYNSPVNALTGITQETFVTFDSPGIWKITLYSAGSSAKQITPITRTIKVI